MAIATTSSFNPDVSELVEEAFELAGAELKSGYELRSARRSLNMLMLEWQNKGINLWTVDEEMIAERASDSATLTTNFLEKGVASYNVPTGTISILNMVLRTNDGNTSTQSDLTLSRISEPTYSQIPAKLTEGRPVQFYFQRLEVLDTGPTGSDRHSQITVWPVPDKSSEYKIVFWRLKRIADVGASAANTMEVPDRFLPALVAGLAMKIAMKTPGLEARVPGLQQNYDQVFTEAAEEDRVKTSFRFVPRIMGY